jgi:uncharacterized protein YkwD
MSPLKFALKHKTPVLVFVFVSVGTFFALNYVESRTRFLVSHASEPATATTPPGSIALISFDALGANPAPSAPAQPEAVTVPAAAPDAVPATKSAAPSTSKPAPAAVTPPPTPRPAPTPVETPAPAKAPAPKAETKPMAQESCSGALTQHFLCLLNNYRASQGKGKLSYNSGLAQVALGHSSWMAATGTFSHTGENGSRLNTRCQAAGITCRAENLAKNIGSAQALFDMWKNSPGHNANLLGPYTTIGIGISGEYTTALFN